jgi:hypothetical protein
MTPSQPPLRATRMMQRAGIEPAIIGDLIEEYSKGRSSLWYWMQALGAFVTKAPTLSPYMASLRWLIALPFAMLAAAAVPRIANALFLPWFSFNPGVMMAFYATSFLMPAIFVGAFVWIAPSRKYSVARIALAIVGFYGALIAMAPFFFGQPFDSMPVFGGISALLGGVVGYLCCRSRSAAYPITP